MLVIVGNPGLGKRPHVSMHVNNDNRYHINNTTKDRPIIVHCCSEMLNNNMCLIKKNVNSLQLTPQKTHIVKGMEEVLVLMFTIASIHF